MAITTYSELKDAIANWSARGDLATAGANVNRVDEIIDNAEAMFNRDLRTLDQETKSTLTINGEYVSVPSDFLELRTLYLNTSPKRTVAFLPNDTQTDYFGSGTGIPRFVTVDGGKFRFGPVPDGSYDATIQYWAKIPALNGTTTTNWLLTSHPDIYLAACMLWTNIFLQDASAAATWKSAYEQLAASLSMSNNWGRYGAGGMAVRVA